MTGEEACQAGGGESREGLQAVGQLVVAYADAFPILPTLGTLAASMLAETGARDDSWRHYERFAAASFAILPDDQNWLMGMAHLALTCTRL